jgi:hypothetical protein
MLPTRTQRPTRDTPAARSRTRRPLAGSRVTRASGDRRSQLGSDLCIHRSSHRKTDASFAHPSLHRRPNPRAARAEPARLRRPAPAAPRSPGHARRAAGTLPPRRRRWHRSARGLVASPPRLIDRLPQPVLCQPLRHIAGRRTTATGSGRARFSSGPDGRHKAGP